MLSIPAPVRYLNLTAETKKKELGIDTHHGYLMSSQMIGGTIHLKRTQNTVICFAEKKHLAGLL